MNNWTDNLKRMKKHSRMTTREIAEGSGIPEPTLEKLFSGQTKDPKLDTMRTLVHFLGFSLDDLVTENVINSIHKKNSASAENAETENEEKINLFYDYLVELRYIQAGEVLTMEQMQDAVSVIRIIDKVFGRKTTTATVGEDGNFMAVSSGE